MTENQATEQSVAEAMQVPESAAGLDVQLAQELIEKARRSGVSVGPDGLLAGVNRTVLQNCAGRGDDRAPGR